MVNPSSKLTLVVTATSSDPAPLLYSWQCPTDPSLLLGSRLQSPTSTAYLVLSKGALDPWSVSHGIYRFTVTASSCYGNATAAVSLISSGPSP